MAHLSILVCQLGHGCCFYRQRHGFAKSQALVVGKIWLHLILFERVIGRLSAAYSHNFDKRHQMLISSLQQDGLRLTRA